MNTNTPLFRTVELRCRVGEIRPGESSRLLVIVQPHRDLVVVVWINPCDITSAIVVPVKQMKIPSIMLYTKYEDLYFTKRKLSV
jgi:hypothetical protein